MFLCDNVNLYVKVFNTFNFETNFLENKTFFEKLEYRFLVESTKLKTHHFHTKLPHQKPMLRQIEWWLQNGPVKKNGLLPVNNLFF